ncbi:hypothetical protein [Chitinophaga vietnamensis]|uniref:hypothetical protein n=1 Tax=Chitinophaga vietnamensis TaxID=2593957 RepID=UPI0011776395|nr:hypothetical protein [Chitinophaga vietnamensis]
MSTEQVYKKMPTRTIILAGLLVGTLDILTACIITSARTGRPFSTVLRFVASGVFGRSAFTAEGMPYWGLFFHYVIAFAFTIFFFQVYPFLHRTFKNGGVIAVVYGLFNWAVMNLAVLPLSRVAGVPFTWTSTIINAFILIVMIATPLTLIAQRTNPK